jgi:very-short-patch-repair endonuclease
VSIPAPRDRCRPGLVVHRRSQLPPGDVTERDGTPVTIPARTLIDIARRLDRGPLEAAINEADKHDLIDPQALREAVGCRPSLPGTSVLRSVLDRQTFTLTDSELERRFLALVEQVGLPRPLTQARVNGFKVDFYWPELSLVVETDGLRYHRTPAQQARDRLRDQTQTAAGLTCLRFTHAQVYFEPVHVRDTLGATAAQMRRRT